MRPAASWGKSASAMASAPPISVLPASTAALRDICSRSSASGTSTMAFAPKEMAPVCNPSAWWASPSVSAAESASRSSAAEADRSHSAQVAAFPPGSSRDGPVSAAHSRKTSA